MTWRERLLGSVEWLVKKGFNGEEVPAQVAEERLKICESNGCKMFDPVGYRCRSCGCFLRVKTKLIVDPMESFKQGQEVLTKCPKGLWGEFIKQPTNPNI